MKKHVLRLLLFAITLVFSTNALADKGSATVKMTWVDYDAPSESKGEIATGETARAGYNKIADGAVGFGNTGWGENKITYLQVDASALEGTITGATLTMDVSGSSDSKRQTAWGVGYNNSDWSASMTYETADKSITLLGGTQGTSTKSASTFETKSFDIKDAFKNDADKIVTILVYETAAAGGYIKNPTVTIEYTNGAIANYTVKYMCGETEIKDAATRSGIVGEKAALETGDDAAVYANDKKYIYTGNNIEDVTIANDGSSIIIVKFREAAVYNYSLLSSLGSTIAAGTGFEGDNATVGYPHYAIAEGIFYEAAATNKVYAKDIALTADNATETITYTAKDGINAIFFAEGENVDGMTVSTAGNVPIRASNAKAGVSSEDITITTLAAGKYILHVGAFTSKTSAQTIYVGYGETQIAFASSSNLSESASDEITLTKGTAIKYFGTTSSTDAQFDYIWIEKTGDVSNDYTSYIVNANLKGEGGFDATETKGIDGSGIVKVSSGKIIDFKQTIVNLPAGQYKLTAQAAYRYSGSEADEAAAIAAGTETKLAKLYATAGTKTVSTPVQNRYDGASETDYANGNGSTIVNGKYVPNSSAAVQAWFNAGQYINEVTFNLPEDGNVTIGIVKTAQPEASDYVVIGPWTLTRLGDAEAEPQFDPSTVIVNAAFNPAADPKGWTEVVSESFRDINMYQIGGDQMVRFAAPTADETHLNTEYAAGFECRWNGNFAAYQQATAELPAGSYKLTYDVENVNGNTQSVNYNNLFTVSVGETVYTDKKTEWMKGKSTWTTHSITFILTEAAPVTISLGYGTGSNNISNEVTPALYVSHLQLVTCDPLEEAKINAIAALEALAPVGDGLFFYNQADIDAAKTAVTDAETIEAVAAVAMPQPTAPAANKAYTFQLRLKGEAPLYMALAEDGITIAEEATPLKFIVDETAGQYFLANEDNTLFVGLAGGNAWTMSTAADKKAAWTFTALPDGGYRINNLVTTGCFVGTNSDDKEAGKPCYADKLTSNGNVDWIITKIVAPETALIKPTIGITEKYTSIAELGGKTFAIINETESKALYGTNNQNLGYDVYGSAFSASNSGYLWKLVSLADDADADVHNYYRFQLVTPSGADYNCWGMGGWLNSQPADGGCSFILGLSDKNGQDIKNGAVYDVQYVEGQGFTIKNIGTGLYQGANTLPAKAEEPSYFTFASVGTSYIPTVETLLAEGKGWKALVKDEAAIAAYDAAVADIDPATIEGDGLAEAKTIDAAIVELAKAQPAEADADFTRAIANPSFEIGNADGWTSNDGGWVANNGNFGAATGSFFVEKWTASSGKLSDGSFLQSIKGLPTGKYKLTAEMQNREQGNSDAAGTGLFLVANEGKAETITSDGKTFEVIGTAKRGTLEIGTKLENCSGNWICFDNFKLTYVEALPADFVAAMTALETAIKEAKAINTTDLQGVEALNTAISTAETALESIDATIESLTAAKTALKEAVTAFKTLNAKTILVLKGTVGEEVSLTFGAWDTEDTYSVDFGGDNNVQTALVGIDNKGPVKEDGTTASATKFTGTVGGDGTITVKGFNDIWYLITTNGVMPTTFDQPSLMNVVQMTITGADVEKVELPAYPKMTQFNFNNSSVKSVDVSKVTTLTSLSINNTSASKFEPQLENIDVSKNTELTYLSLQGNQNNYGKLTSIDVTNNTKLENLMLQYNAISSVNFGAESYSKLGNVNIQNNKLTSFSSARLPYLKTLFLSDNLLTSIDLSTMNRAKGTVNVYNNQLTELIIPVSMATVQAQNNKLKKVQIADITTQVKLENNELALNTLPTLFAGISSKPAKYTYAPQAALEVAENVSELDLSSQLTATGILTEPATTTYSFVTESGTALVEGTDYEVTEPGKFKFLTAQTEKVHGVMANEAFPKFTGANAYVTTDFTVIEPVKPIEGISYSWESPAGTPIQWGGTIAYVNGDGDRLNYKNADYYTICLNGKKANMNDETASANAGKMVITLDKALAEGDTIAYTAFINKDASKQASAYILFENGTDAEGEVFSDEANIDATFNGVPTLKYTVVPAEAAGSKTITLTRSKTGTNLFITKLQVIEKVAEPEPEPIDPDLVEIPQDQGKDLDTFTRTELVEGDKYNTYTANGDLNIAFKMMNIDVKDCDYVVVKFAEPVAAGWHLAFWSNQDLVDVPAGATEYKYVFADDPKCAVSEDGVLPQICMMTFFGGFEAPLVAKVSGIYKHKVPAPTELAQELNVERYPGLGYGVTEATVDFTEAKAFLGVEEITTDMLSIVNPDGTLISNYAAYDGWFNGEGAAETWGSNTKVCVKFFQAIPEGTYQICDMNGADEIGKTYTVKWALKANDKTVTYTINVKFVEKPVITLTFADLNKVDEQTVALTSELGKCYERMSADVDVAAILTKLGVESLGDATIYAVQSNGTLDDNYKVGNTDGWRNAVGDWQSWGADAYFYVKANFALESAQLYEVGGMDGKNTTAEWEKPATYTATYAFVKKGTADAVVLKVTLTYTVPTGVNAINRDAQNAVIYNVNGQKMNKAQKGLNIINGRKVVVK